MYKILAYHETVNFLYIHAHSCQNKENYILRKLHKTECCMLFSILSLSRGGRDSLFIILNGASLSSVKQMLWFFFINWQFWDPALFDKIWLI